MKYLKPFNESINRSEIDAICKEYKIENYNINEDGTIDVNGDVDLTNYNLLQLPLKFNRVIGFFTCDFNKLKSLKGIPKYIGSGFTCRYNDIKNIDYFPTLYNRVSFDENPIEKILQLFIKFSNTDAMVNIKENKELIYEFKNREIIQNDILILDRLVEFLEDIGKPRTKEYLQNLLQKEYTIR